MVGVGVLKLNARPVARTIRWQFERRPGDGRVEAEPLISLERHADALVRSQRRRRDDLRANHREVDDAWPGCRR